MGHSVLSFRPSRGEGESEPATLAAQLAAEQRESAHLRLALTNSRTIGMAMGIVMERRKCTPDCAFAVLRTISQHQNRKLHLVAADVVATGEFPDPQ
jgi:AmiR/NasT family two-component response regulator